jgi:glycosyltransferase involved in cell wall biosynthesis
VKIAATGFVSLEAGSVASANAIILKSLLKRGYSIDFFSKPSFVDPRPVVENLPNFRFYDCTNFGPDAFRRKTHNLPIVGFASGGVDAATYNKFVIRRIAEVAKQHGKPYEVVLWLGDYAHGTVPGSSTVSFAQGPPGTDARSIIHRRKEIRELAGLCKAIRLEVLARLRLTRLGLPRFRFSDQIIVGSKQSKETLKNRYGIEEQCISILPYPIDLDLFRPDYAEHSKRSKTLRVLWLGRIVPRKRLDLFLDGASLALQRGANIELTIVGGIGFVPGYEKLIQRFPFPQQLTYQPSLPRAHVAALFSRHHILCQPSDEENFGSSVAEAQACGLRVIVGHSNGNADYLCSRDFHLPDDNPHSLARMLLTATSDFDRKDESMLHVSRRFAEQTFACKIVVDQLEKLLLEIAAKKYQ